MTLALDDHQVEQRKVTIVSKLESLGDVTVSDVPRARRRRLIEVHADAPGADLPTLASFDYRELFERHIGKWHLQAYAYEYLDRDHGGRRAHHWHDESFHAHCVDPRRKRRGHQYRAAPIDVFEAHDEFAHIYLSGEEISCDDLRPLLDWMGALT